MDAVIATTRADAVPMLGRDRHRPDFMLADAMYIASPGREFADASGIDPAGVKVGLSHGGGSDQNLSLALQSAQVVRVPRGVANSVEALRNGSVDVRAANLVALQHIEAALAGSKQASLQATLAAGAWQGQEVWVFPYGSLLWKPAFEAAEQVAAMLAGWHRSFCIRLTRFRGTPVPCSSPTMRKLPAIPRCASACCALRHLLALQWLPRARTTRAKARCSRWVRRCLRSPHAPRVMSTRS